MGHTPELSSGLIASLCRKNQYVTKNGPDHKVISFRPLIHQAGTIQNVASSPSCD